MPRRSQCNCQLVRIRQCWFGCAQEEENSKLLCSSTNKQDFPLSPFPFHIFTWTRHCRVSEARFVPSLCSNLQLKFHQFRRMWCGVEWSGYYEERLGWGWNTIMKPEHAPEELRSSRRAQQRTERFWLGLACCCWGDRASVFRACTFGCCRCCCGCGCAQRY